MQTSTTIIVIVVAIIVIKLVAVHMYLKTKINQSLEEKEQNDEKSED